MKKLDVPGDHDRNEIGPVVARRASLEEKAVRGVEGERADIEAGHDRDVTVGALDQHIASCEEYEQMSLRKRNVDDNHWA